jgi:hypothetical protein
MSWWVGCMSRFRFWALRFLLQCSHDKRTNITDIGIDSKAVHIACFPFFGAMHCHFVSATFPRIKNQNPTAVALEQSQE